MFKPGDKCIIINDPFPENIGKEITLADREYVMDDGKKYIPFDSGELITVSDFGRPDNEVTAYDFEGYITEDCIKLVEKFLLQDSRSYAGNNILWWGKSGGYTTNVDDAQLFTREEALAQHAIRNSDIPWLHEYIMNHTRKVVDMQEVERQLWGVSPTVEKKKKQEPLRCGGCGQFMSRVAYYTEPCKKCGVDNRP